MPKSITFTDIDASADGHLRCTVQRGENSDELWFELPHAFSPAPDLIAATYVTLAGTAFDEVRVDLPLGARAAANVSAATGVEVTHLPGKDVDRGNSNGHALNFSGGFDSLAAQAIIPDADLISLDFGGNFARERPAFSRFSPHIIRTNLVDLGLNLHSWQFMGVGSILLRDELQIGTYSFGSVQAGSLPKLFTGPVARSGTGLSVAPALGMEIANPVAGVSEVGAVAIASRTYPDLLGDVLESVARPGGLKHRRKRLMLEAVADREGLTLDLPRTPALERRPVWGANFTNDLSSLYVMKVLGPEAVSATYEGGVPDVVVSRVAATGLHFMERFNPHAYVNLDRPVVADWYSRLVMLGVMPYGREDWADAATAMKAVRGQL